MATAGETVITKEQLVNDVLNKASSKEAEIAQATLEARKLLEVRQLRRLREKDKAKKGSSTTKQSLRPNKPSETPTARTGVAHLTVVSPNPDAMAPSKKKVTVTDKKFKELQALNKDLKKKNKDLENENEKFVTQLEKLTEKLDNAIPEPNDLKKAHDTLKAKHDTLTKEKTRVVKKNIDLTKENLSLRSSLMTAQNGDSDEITTLKALHEKLKKDYDTLSEWNVTLNKTIEDLKKTGCDNESSTLMKEHERLTEDFNRLSRENDTLTKENEALKKTAGTTTEESDLVTQLRSQNTKIHKDHDIATEACRLLKQDKEKLKKKNEDLKEMNAQMEEQLKECHKVIKEAGKFCSFEESKDVVVEYRKFIKTDGYRHYKLLATDEEEKKFMKACYSFVIMKRPTVGDTNHEDYCSFPEFERIYTKGIKKAHNKRRQLSATCLQDAVWKWYQKHEFVPTIAQIKKVAMGKDQPAKEENKEAYQEWKDMVFWYYDVFIPAGCGRQDVFPPSIRNYEMMVAPRKVTSSDGKTQKNCPNISAMSEAFAWMLYENSEERWLEICKAKTADPSFDTPSWSKKKDEEWTEKYNKTKWSLPHSGQIEGGGWKAGAYTQVNMNVAEIIKFRKEDKAAKWKWNQYMKGLVRKRKDVKAKKQTGKRKRGKEKPVEKPIVYEVIEEVDESYSVHSNDEEEDFDISSSEEEE